MLGQSAATQRYSTTTNAGVRVHEKPGAAAAPSNASRRRPQRPGPAIGLTGRCTKKVSAAASKRSTHISTTYRVQLYLVLGRCGVLPGLISIALLKSLARRRLLPYVLCVRTTVIIEGGHRLSLGFATDFCWQQAATPTRVKTWV